MSDKTNIFEIIIIGAVVLLASYVFLEYNSKRKIEQYVPVTNGYLKITEPVIDYNDVRLLEYKDSCNDCNVYDRYDIMFEEPNDPFAPLASGSLPEMKVRKISRNPINNINNTHTNNVYDKTKSQIRDFDDSMVKLLYKPVQVEDNAPVESMYANINNIECDNFGEPDRYKESVLKYKLTDSVDKVNDYRSTDKHNFLGKPVADVFDELSGSNDMTQNNLLEKEGTSFNKVSKKNKIFEPTRWHYSRENSNNGGVIYGSNGLKGYTNDDLFPAIQY